MSPRKRTSLVVALCIVSFSSLLAQTVIRERVEIEPKNEIAQPNAAVATADMFQVTYSYTGTLDNSNPSNNTVSASHRWCPISASAPLVNGSASVTVEAAAGSNMFWGGRLKLPQGSTGTREFRGYLNGVEIFHTSDFVPPIGPGGATIVGSVQITFFPAMDLPINANPISHGGQKTLAVNPVASPFFCAQGAPVWHPEVPVTIEIVAGGELGQFKDLSTGQSLGTSFERKRSQLGSVRYVADGVQPPEQQATVTIKASYGGVQDQASFIVNRTVPLPTVNITNPPEDITIELTSTNKPTISLEETHTPGPGQQYEPEIIWSPSQTINTADYYDQIEDSLVIVARVFATLENATAEDSVRITLKKEANRPPVIDSLVTSTGDDYFAVGSQVTLLGYYHDDDDNVVSVEWEEVVSSPPPPPVTITATNKDSVLRPQAGLSVASAEQANSVATAAVTIGKVGENKFRLTVRDAFGEEEIKEIAIEGIEPCGNVAPNVTFTVVPLNDNKVCMSDPDKPLGVTYPDNSKSGCIVEACLSPNADSWEIQLKEYQATIVWGVCNMNAAQAGLLIVDTEFDPIITSSSYCLILKKVWANYLIGGVDPKERLWSSGATSVHEELGHVPQFKNDITQLVHGPSGLAEQMNRLRLDKKLARNPIAAKNALSAKIEDICKSFKKWLASFTLITPMRDYDELEARKQNKAFYLDLYNRINNRAVNESWQPCSP